MHEEHFIKTDPTLEPHGIIGQALSLVLSPEEPGYSGTTIDLMEMYEKPVLRLLETVMKSEKEKMKALKKAKEVAVIQPESRQTFDKQIREQSLAPDPEDPGAAAQEPVQDESGKVECEEGSHWDDESGTCVPDEVPAVNITKPPEVPEKTAQEQAEAEHCAQGFKWNPESALCEPEEIPAVTPPVNAPADSVPIGIPKVDAPATPAPILAPDIVTEQEGVLELPDHREHRLC